MPVAMNVTSQQNLEVVVSGPGPVTRMFIVSGIGETNLASGGSPKTETFTALVGPVLTSAQFVRAIATASLAGVYFTTPGGGPAHAPTWRVMSVDADYDDESGQVNLSIEASIQSASYVYLEIKSVSFQATILAAL